MGINFNVAAEAATVAEDEDVVEVPINGVTYFARRPTVAQAALLNLGLTSDGAQRLSVSFRLIEALLGEDALAVVQDLVWKRRIDFGDLIGGTEENPDGGLIDQIFAEFSKFPTEPSTDSSASRTIGGRKSTGRSPGKGSIRSSGPSTDS